MNKEVIDRWIERLESGEIKQGRGRLGRVDGSRCCLGVLCDLAVEDEIIPPPVSVHEPELAEVGLVDSLIYGGTSWNSSKCTLPKRVYDWAGIRTAGARWFGNGHEALEMSLVHLNDSGANFEEIAAILRNPPKGLLADE